MKEIIINAFIVVISLSAYISLLELVKKLCKSYLKGKGAEAQ